MKKKLQKWWFIRLRFRPRSSSFKAVDQRVWNFVSASRITSARSWWDISASTIIGSDTARSGSHRSIKRRPVEWKVVVITLTGSGDGHSTVTWGQAAMSSYKNLKWCQRSEKCGFWRRWSSTIIFQSLNKLQATPQTCAFQSSSNQPSCLAGKCTRVWHCQVSKCLTGATFVVHNFRCWCRATCSLTLQYVITNLLVCWCPIWKSMKRMEPFTMDPKVMNAASGWSKNPPAITSCGSR